MGSAGEAEYWVALKENGALCLITTFLAAESESVGMTCGAEDGSLGTGLSTKAVDSSQWDEGVRSEASLLPDDVDAAPLNDHLVEYLLPLEAPCRKRSTSSRSGREAGEGVVIRGGGFRPCRRCSGSRVGWSR